MRPEAILARLPRRSPGREAQVVAAELGASPLVVEAVLVDLHAARLVGRRNRRHRTTWWRTDPVITHPHPDQIQEPLL